MKNRTYNRWSHTVSIVKGGRRNGDAQPLQFANDAQIAPPRVLARQPQNQLANLPPQALSTGSPAVRPTLHHQAAMPTDPTRQHCQLVAKHDDLQFLQIIGTEPEDNELQDRLKCNVATTDRNFDQELTSTSDVTLRLSARPSGDRQAHDLLRVVRAGFGPEKRTVYLRAYRRGLRSSREYGVASSPPVDPVLPRRLTRRRARWESDLVHLGTHTRQIGRAHV